MDDEVLYECGVDIDSSFTFQDGDLVLSEYENNIVQAVTNRLNTDLDELDLFYEDYGSILTGFLGWKASDALEYIQAEIDNVLLQEPRLIRHDSNVEYTETGVIRINLTLYTSSNIGIEANLVLTKDGVVEIEIDENEEE